MGNYLWFIPSGFVIGTFGTLIGVGLIKTEPKKTREVYNQLKNMEGGTNIVTVFARFDLVVMDPGARSRCG